MEDYIVIAKFGDGEKEYDKPEDYRIIKKDEQIPPGYKKVFGPSNLECCVKFIKEKLEKQPNWYALTIWQYVLIAAVTLIFVIVVCIGAYKLYYSDATQPLRLVTNVDDAARILITFLVAVATVGIGFLAILTAMVIREYKERFALAKEVFTILVGILGTIVGFYFGTANNQATRPDANINAAAVNISNTASNTNANSSINTNVNAAN